MAELSNISIKRQKAGRESKLLNARNGRVRSRRRRNHQAKSHRGGSRSSSCGVCKSTGDRTNGKQPAAQGASQKFSTTNKAPLATFISQLIINKISGLRGRVSRYL